MFINDVPNLNFSPWTKVSLYADDTAIFHPGRDAYKVSQEQLQADTLLLSKWFSDRMFCKFC